ncbi:MAG: hypothetical protein IPJ04_12230 [Candidatus Eisenbacteria bacterium]|nr:hypothetical protein [Candidatus Eisenbacteria bacterium]
MPLSAALLSAKISAPGTGPTNNAKYQLMGDAATVLNTPRLWADVTLTDAGGAPITKLQRGQTVTFQGRVLERPAAARCRSKAWRACGSRIRRPPPNTGTEPPCTYYGVDYRYRRA